MGSIEVPLSSALRAPIDFVAEDGIKISVNLRPKVSNSSPRIGLYRGEYGVLVNPDVLLDSFTDPDNQFAVAIENGTVVARRNNPNEQLLQSLIASPGNGIDERYLYSAVREGGLTAVATKPRSDIMASFGRQTILFVPLGLIAAIPFAGGIAWVTRRRLSPFGELKVAVRQRHFIVHYQPILDIQTGRCVGAEALVRWLRNGEVILPAKFIDVAEASGLILPMTDQVIETVVNDLAPTLRADRSMHVAINLPASDVSNGRALEVIERDLVGTGIEKRQIWLEMTERGFVNISGARDVLLRARERGYTIAIDDFGTGFSSLQYLESLPIDILKIDKSFVDTIGKITSRSPVLPHIIEIARSLNLVCLAEGVETVEQLDYLREKGVERAQGWLISKPLAAAEFVAFYLTRKTALAVRNEG